MIDPASKIWVVVGVFAIIITGIAGFLIFLERKLDRIEKKLDQVEKELEK